MREVVTLHLGQAGSQVGLNLWDHLCCEHGIDRDGTSSFQRQAGDPFGSFFHETPSNQFVPRAVFCDSDPLTTADIIGHRSPYRKLFSSDSVLGYKQDAKGNFFEGRRQAVEYHMTEAVIDRLRNQTELCDNLAGFFTFHSFGGGTGTGLGVEVLEAIKEYFGKTIVFEPVIYPSEDISANVMEPYNCLFATAYTRETASLTTMLDNQGAYDLCRSKLDISKPSYADMNRLIAQMVSGSTASLRFDAMLNATLSEIVTNSVPDPALHYTLLSVAPLSGSGKHASTTKQMVNDLFEPGNFLADVSAPHLLKNNRYLAASVLLRGTGDGGGPLQAGEAVAAVHSLTGPGSKSFIRPPTVRFTPWTPNGFKVGIVGVPPYIPMKSGPNGDSPFMAPTDRQAVLLANTTAVRALFLRQYRKFLRLFFHKAGVWQFLEAGGELDLFYEAKESVAELLQLYQDVLTNCVGMEEDCEVVAMADRG